MSDIKFHYQRTGIPVSPTEVILSYEKYKKLRSLLREGLEVTKCADGHWSDTVRWLKWVDKVEEELVDAPTLER